MVSQIEGGFKGGMKKRRRTRTDHPGVKLRKRVLKNGREFWFARFVDPDTDKTTDVTLEALAETTRETRRQWAIKKSTALAKRRSELAAGAPKRSYTLLGEATATYLEGCASRLRPRTSEVYTAVIDIFTAWAKKEKLDYIEDLTAGKLAAFKDSRTAARRHVVKKGDRRGGRQRSTAARSPTTINTELRTIKTMALKWRSEGKLPNADSEQIGRALKLLPLSKEPPAYLNPADCRALLESALAHDSALFTATREEHAGLKPLGTTLKHRPVAPFAIFLLLSGCRFGEAINLAWQDVDLEAMDAEGRKVGEIILRATATKTKHWRAIGLEVSPTLRAMLTAMKPRAGSGAFVFGGLRPLSRMLVEATRKRLIRTYGAPRFSWQNLRQTTGTFLTNAPGIYGAASAFMSARQLGHSVAVAEKHYLGVIRGISREARTLEAAMQIEDLTRQVVEAVSQPREAAIIGERND